MHTSLIRAMPGPMEGVMTMPLIKTWQKMCLTPVIMSPFLRVSESVPPEKILLKFIAPYVQCGIPYIIQTMGTDPVKLGQCAIALSRLGVNDINLNFGCPSGQVISSGAGGGVLRNPLRLLEIVQEVKNCVPKIHLSIKLRAGFAAFNECKPILESLDQTNAADFIVLHYRTVKEQYRPIANGEQRWDFIAKLQLKTPLVVNGDINTLLLANEVLNQANASGVMCGRGLFRDPYLLARILSPNEVFPEHRVAQREFFTSVISEAESLDLPYTPGAAIELSNLIFGPANPFFEQLKTLNINRVKSLSLTGLGSC